MHTASQLQQSMFAIEINGERASREQLFPDWEPHDRLGVIAHEPLGAVGASLLIQLAITAFYDVRQERRSKERPQYPEFFLFHVGGYVGDHRFFDFWPPRKEVELPDDPHAVLSALNDRAVTRLLVVDGEPQPVEHEWKEPASAFDRVVSVFAYDPGGRTSSADVAIRGTHRRVLANTTMTLHPERWPNTPLRQQRPTERHTDTRIHTLLAHSPRVDAQRQTLIDEDGVVCESYRRIELDEGLNLLHAHQPAAVLV